MPYFLCSSFLLVSSIFFFSNLAACVSPTGTSTRCGAVSSAINGSLWERWTKWNVTEFFLSMNFFVFPLGWKNI